MPELCYSLDGGETFQREPIHDLLERDRENWEGRVPQVIEADVREMTTSVLADAITTSAGLNGYLLDQLDTAIQGDWCSGDEGWFDCSDRPEIDDADFFDAAALMIAYGLAHTFGLPWTMENQRDVTVEQDEEGRWGVVALDQVTA